MDPDREYWRRHYDELAARGGADWEVGGWLSRHYYAMVQDCLRRIFLACQGERGKALDVCCGPGTQLALLAALGYRPVGMDCSEGVIRRLKRVGSFPVLVGDAMHPPFSDASFDLVASVGMLQCVADLDGYFEELGRALNRSEGRLVLLFSPASWLVRLRRWFGLRRHNAHLQHYRLHRPRDVRAALYAAGFGSLETIYLYYVFYAPLLRPLLRFVNRHWALGRLFAPLATHSVMMATRLPLERPY